jgi:hypothetical protein
MGSPLRLALAYLRRADTGSSRVEQACRLLMLAIEDARAHAA